MRILKNIPELNQEVSNNLNKITVEKDGHILLIGLNRAEKLNAFDVEMYIDLAKAYGELHTDKDLRCGLLFAHGKSFTAGLELDKWASAFSGGSFPELPEGAVDPLGIDEDNRLAKPMIMAAKGICFTIGLELMMATDIRVAAEGTRFGQIEVKRGIYPVGGATMRFFEEIGWSNAMLYLLTGDELSVEDAYRLRMIQKVTEPGKEFDTALEIAKRVAKQAPLAVQAALKASRRARANGPKEAVKHLLPELQPLMNSEDVLEGLQSFLERREANFKGK